MDAQNAGNSISRFQISKMFLGLSQVVYRNTATVLRAHDTLVRANKVLERPEKWPKFHIIYNNCETFATWLKTGQGFSVQVQDRLIYGLTSMTALGLLLLFLYNSQ